MSRHSHLVRRAWHWAGIIIGAPFVAGAVISFMMGILMGRPKVTPWSAISTIAAVVIYALLAVRWKKGLFALNDFLALVTRYGAKISRVKFNEPGVPFSELFHFVDGFLNKDVYFIARLDRPLMAYFPIRQINRGLLKSTGHLIPQSERLWGGLNPSYMAQASTVDFFCLAGGGPLKEEIFFWKGAEVPRLDIGSPEISKALEQWFSEIDHLRVRILWNEEWFRLTIVGGSWLGDCFKSNISNGLALFTLLKERLLVGRPHRSFSEWRVAWDPAVKDYTLKRDGQVSVG